MEYSLIECEQEIKKIVGHTLKTLQYPDDIKLETPPDATFGDFSFPCFSLAPIAKKAPHEIAIQIIEKLGKSTWIDKVEGKGGYVNFFINNEKLIRQTLETIQQTKEKYGWLSSKKQKVIIEHTSANPNGPLHVGRARNPIIGDTMVRLYRAAGYNVESQFYLDDMGKQVAILAWGLQHLNTKDIPLPEYKKPDHQYVGYYQKTNKLIEEKPEINHEIQEIIQKSEQGEKNTVTLIKEAYEPVLEGMKQSLDRTHIIIDRFVPESTFVTDGSVDNVIKELKKIIHCSNEEGAFFLDLKSFGIKGRNTKFFFTRNDGTTLYATRDIAYHQWKAQQADILINILGEDHKLESKQVEIALTLLGVKNIPTPIFYAFVSLPGGKMSTRRARVVYLDELIDECVERAYTEVKKRRGNDLSEEKMQEIAEHVGIGALRYNIIKVQPEKDIVFKWEEALNFEGNAVPFIQYAHARACSILTKQTSCLDNKPLDSSCIQHSSEISLLKHIAKFPIVIHEASTGFKPHIVTTYLFECASRFNQFYRDCPVIPEKNIKKKQARLCIVDATRVVLFNGLDLLGIIAPKEM